MVPILPSVGTPVISATIPPSWVLLPPSLPAILEAGTMFRPSIITIFD